MIPIVFICDENYIMPASVAVSSIIQNKLPTTTYEINIITTSQDPMEQLKSMSADKVSVNIIHKENIHENLGLEHKAHVSRAALLKFNIADILAQYDKILYLDGDIVVECDLSELYDTDISECYAGVVRDIVSECVHGDHARLGHEAYFNSGVMLLNADKLRKDNIAEKLTETKKIWQSGKYQDQDIFNKVFGSKVLYLPNKYNYISDCENYFSKSKISKFYGSDDKAVIIHYAGLKPWNYKNVKYGDLWREYYKLSPYKNEKLNLKTKRQWLPPMIKEKIKKLLKIN